MNLGGVMIKYVIYRRVSTKEQGKSGLGLEAQTRDINTYLESHSSKPYEVIGEYLDILSGSEDARPELDRAIALAKKEKAILLVSKLDRLSRKLSFIANLMEDKSVEFKVATHPQASTFELHIYASLAQQEREFISQRTKSALREAKARGVKLGGLRDGTMERIKAKQANALAHAKTLEGIVLPLRKQGKTLSQICQSLTKANLKAPKGGDYQPTQVMRILKLLA